MKKIIIVLYILIFHISTMCCECSELLSGRMKYYTYFIFGLSENHGGYYSISYNTHQSKKTSKTHVTITINNLDDIVFCNKSVIFAFPDGGIEQYFTDNTGSVVVTLNSVLKQPTIKIAEIDTVCNNWVFKYSEMDIDIFPVSIYKDNGNAYYIDKIEITLKKMLPKISYYKVESEIPLDKYDIEQIKTDIISGQRNCELWKSIVVIPYVEI